MSTESPFIPFHTPSPHDTPNSIPLQQSSSPWEGFPQFRLNQWHGVKKDGVDDLNQYHRRRKGHRRSALDKETERQLRFQLCNAANTEQSMPENPGKCEERGEERDGGLLQVAKNGANNATHMAIGCSYNIAHSPRRQSLRRVVPRLPRPPTSKRVLSERRDRLYRVETSQSERNRSISTDRKLLRHTSCSPINSSPPYTPSWLSTPEMRIRKPDRSSSQPGTSREPDGRSPNANDTGNDTFSADTQHFGLLPPPHFNGEGDDPEDRGDRQGGDGEDDDEDDLDPHILQEEIRTKWILNLSMHFRDHSDREKFFLTYAEEQNRWRRVTVTCDYRDVPEDSLESELRSLHYQRDKSERIYMVIRDSLPDIQFFDTVTNLRLKTSDDQLHVDVTEDVNEIISYPSSALLLHIRCPRYTESAVKFESHLSGFVYKVGVNGQVWIKKEIPGPGSVDEFLYEVNALATLRGRPNIIQLGGLVVDDSGELIKGLLISYAEQGSLVDLLGDLKGSIDLPWSRRERWAREIVTGLSELHESGFVQGDFTLSNIVIDEADHARIIDVNRRGCPMGWEPPEFLPLIHSGQRIAMHIGVKCDLFQLGMVLWALAEEDEEPETEERPLAFSSGRQRTIPSYFKHIVQDCLSDDPRGRPSAKDLLLRFSSVVQDDHEAARGRLERTREGSGSGNDNRRVVSEVPASPENAEQGLPVDVAEMAIDLDDVEHLRRPRPRPNSFPHVQIDDFPAGTVTYGNLLPSTEHSPNSYRRPLSQRSRSALSHSPCLGDQSVDALSLLSSELGGSDEVVSSVSGEEDIHSAYGIGESQQTDTSRWQQVYDAEGTRQLVNRASLAMVAHDETSLVRDEVRSIPPISTTSDPSDAAYHLSPEGSPQTVRLVSPSAGCKSPMKDFNDNNRVVHDGMSDCAETLNKPLLPPSEGRTNVEMEHKPKQGTTKQQTLPLAPEPPSHPSHSVSDTECINQSVSPYDEYRDKPGHRSAIHHLIRNRRSSHGDKTAFCSGSGTSTSPSTSNWANTDINSGNDSIANARKRRSGMGASFHERAKQLRQSYAGQNKDNSLDCGSALKCWESVAAGEWSSQENGWGGQEHEQEKHQPEQVQQEWMAQMKRAERDKICVDGQRSMGNTVDGTLLTKLESKSYDDFYRKVDEQHVINAEPLVQRASTLPTSSKLSKVSSLDKLPRKDPIRSVSPFKRSEESRSTRKLPFFAHAAKAAAAKKNHTGLSDLDSKLLKQTPLPFMTSFSPTSSTDSPLEVQRSQSQSPSPSSRQVPSSEPQARISAAVVSALMPKLAAENKSSPSPIPKRLQQESKPKVHRHLHRASSLPVDIINTRPNGTSAKSRGSSGCRSNVKGIVDNNAKILKTIPLMLLQGVDGIKKPTFGVKATETHGVRLRCDDQIAELSGREQS